MEDHSVAALDSHGVVVVLVSTGVIHRPDFSYGMKALKEEDWELFPDLQSAQEAGAKTCGRCFGRVATD